MVVRGIALGFVPSPWEQIQTLGTPIGGGKTRSAGHGSRLERRFSGTEGAFGRICDAVDWGLRFERAEA
jgi:hypothetical protein